MLDMFLLARLVILFRSLKPNFHFPCCINHVPLVACLTIDYIYNVSSIAIYKLFYRIRIEFICILEFLGVYSIFACPQG